MSRLFKCSVSSPWLSALFSTSLITEMSSIDSATSSTTEGSSFFISPLTAGASTTLGGSITTGSSFSSFGAL